MGIYKYWIIQGCSHNVSRELSPVWGGEWVNIIMDSVSPQQLTSIKHADVDMLNVWALENTRLRESAYMCLICCIESLIHNLSQFGDLMFIRGMPIEKCLRFIFWSDVHRTEQISKGLREGSHSLDFPFFFVSRNTVDPSFVTCDWEVWPRAVVSRETL